MQVDACVDVAAETSVCIKVFVYLLHMQSPACVFAGTLCVCARASGIGGPRCSVRILELGERVALAVNTLKFIRVL